MIGVADAVPSSCLIYIYLAAIQYYKDNPFSFLSPSYPALHCNYHQRAHPALLQQLPKRSVALPSQSDSFTSISVAPLVAHVQ